MNEVLKEWIAKAEGDLLTASRELAEAQAAYEICDRVRARLRQLLGVGE